MASEQVAAEEFETWLRPSQAIALFHRHLNNADTVDILHSNLSSGQLRSAAMAAVITHEDDEEGAGPIERWAIPASCWRVYGKTYVGGIWTTGQVTIGDADGGIIILHGVKFHPEDLESIVAYFGDPELPTVSSDQSTTQKPLADAEMKRFAELYLQIWAGEAKEGKALQAVRACYPENSIGRDPFFAVFRELRGPGKRGKPVIRGK